MDSLCKRHKCWFENGMEAKKRAEKATCTLLWMMITIKSRFCFKAPSSSGSGSGGGTPRRTPSAESCWVLLSNPDRSSTPKLPRRMSQDGGEEGQKQSGLGVVKDAGADLSLPPLPPPQEGGCDRMRQWSTILFFFKSLFYLKAFGGTNLHQSSTLAVEGQNLLIYY